MNAVVDVRQKVIDWAKRLPWWQLALLLVAPALLLALEVATQVAAATYRYAAVLGEPLGALGRVKFYAPWAIAQWALQYGWTDGMPQASLAGAKAGGVAWVLLFLFAAAGKLGRNKGESDLHGSARWASLEDLKKAGLLNGKGIMLCQTEDADLTEVKQKDGTVVLKRPGTFLRHDGPEHALVFAPTRSGKGTGIICPTLLRGWPHSVIVADIKKELWHLTSGARSAEFNNVCIRFEPTDPESARFNPLLEVRKGETTEVRDCQSIAHMLVDSGGGKEWDHWQKTAYTLLWATILHVLYSEEDKSLAGVARFLADPKRTVFDTLDRMMNTKHLGTHAHPGIAEAAREAMNKAENELSGVFSTALASLGLYRDPVIAKVTSGSDFRISDLMYADKPRSLYLVVAPSDINRLQPIIRLVVAQILGRLTESSAQGGGAAYKNRCLVLMDEFPAWGKIPAFDGIPYFAGFGIKCLLITQDLVQLEEKYGEKNSIVANCHVRLTYTANDDRTADRVSKLIGTGTRVTVSRSKSRDKDGFTFKETGESRQETARALLTPDEILHLPMDEAILFIGGMNAYRAKKIRFYADPVMLALSKLPPLSPKEERYLRYHEEKASGGPTPNDWVKPEPVPDHTPKSLKRSIAPAGRA